MGAWLKAEAIESNIEEMKIVAGKCWHLHDEDEWSPRWDGEMWFYPTAEEAEYTAWFAFQVAIAASMWAVRVGIAVLRVPKPLKVSETGSRLGWSQIPYQALRQDAMRPVAVSLGLQPLDRSPGDWFPESMLKGRCTYGTSVEGMVELVKERDGQPPQRYDISRVEQWTDDMVYIGHERNKHHASKTKWAFPEWQSIKEDEDAIEDYMRSLKREDLLELRGKKLVCNCSKKDYCHGDVLVMVYVAQFSQDCNVPVVYVGQGDQKLKMKKTEFASPFRVGHDGSAEECFAQYIDYAKQRGIGRKARQLRGSMLVCDCEVGTPCHRNYLAAMADIASTDSEEDRREEEEEEARKLKRRRRRRRRSSRSRSFVPLAIITGVRSIEGSEWPITTVRWPQKPLEGAIKRLFPREWLP